MPRRESKAFATYRARLDWLVTSFKEHLGQPGYDTVKKAQEYEDMVSSWMFGAEMMAKDFLPTYAARMAADKFGSERREALTTALREAEGWLHILNQIRDLGA